MFSLKKITIRRFANPDNSEGKKYTQFSFEGTPLKGQHYVVSLRKIRDNSLSQGKSKAQNSQQYLGRAKIRDRDKSQI